MAKKQPQNVTMRVRKHNSLNALHTDILMKLYSSYGDIGEALEKIKGWI